MNPTVNPAETQEVYASFRSIEEWQGWFSSRRVMGSEQYLEAAIARIRAQGVVEPLSNQRYSGQQVVIAGDNYRESIRAGQLVSRQRAVLYTLVRLAKEHQTLVSRHAKIYAPEALTSFALYMRGRYPKFIGSEYAETKAERHRIFPILHQDLQNLSFLNDSFDLIVSNDVFEHVPDLDKALSECSRILNPNGYLVATFPFASNKEVGVRKAILENNTVKHLTTPEFHGNPMDPDKGSLVFEVPGWDLVNRAIAAGFADAHFTFVSSQTHGIIAKYFGGVFVFVAKKSEINS